MAKQTMTIAAGRSIEKPGGVTREFLIEYDDADAESGVVRIDGVKVSVELLTTMIVDPPRDRFYRFERKGDTVTVHQVAFRPDPLPLDLE
jgi:hypothetical protein